MTERYRMRLIVLFLTGVLFLFTTNSQAGGCDPLMNYVDHPLIDYSGMFSNFGGVSLSKTADLMLNITDIAGATYDEATGQIILYGKNNISLPKMKLDDLSGLTRDTSHIC